MSNKQDCQIGLQVMNWVPFESPEHSRIKIYIKSAVAERGGSFCDHIIKEK